MIVGGNSSLIIMVLMVVCQCCFYLTPLNCDANGNPARSKHQFSSQGAELVPKRIEHIEAEKITTSVRQSRNDGQVDNGTDGDDDEDKSDVHNDISRLVTQGLPRVPHVTHLHRPRRHLDKRRKEPVRLAVLPHRGKTSTSTSTTTVLDEPTESEEEEEEEEGDEEEVHEGRGSVGGHPSAKISKVETSTAGGRRSTVMGRKSNSSRKSPVDDEKDSRTSSSSAREATLTKTTVTPSPTTKGKPKKVLTGSKGNNVTSAEPGESDAKSLAKPKKKPLVALPFIKPKNESICTPEAYLEFPRDLIGNKWRARGLVLIHIAIVCYMFYSLALVCERYFMPSLEEFSQRLQLSEDVAGATLMSAGSSAPELFTAILGVFIAKGDVGTGAIVGSAVFNILFVIGICAFVSTTSAQLDWWPVLRDSVFYTFTVLVLILFIYDERVTALESFSMIALYGVYILIMIHNEAIKERVTHVLQSHPVTAKLISSPASLEGADDVFSAGSLPTSSSEKQRSFFGSGWNHPNYQTNSMAKKTVEEDCMFMATLLIILRHKRLFRSQLRFQSAARYIIIKRQHRYQKSDQYSTEVNYFGPESGPKGTGNQRDRMEAYAKTASMSKCKFSIVSKDDYQFWNRRPEEGENYYIWMAKIPANYVLHYTVPDCALYPDKFLFTFFLSIAWTAFFSYIMVWMVTLIGYTFGIPDSVMGFTFLAAGTSIPDCYSSIHAARNGMANMAVSNSIGSNVFDILIGLSLPWFIQTALYPGVVATINSRGVIYSVVLLFLSLVVTIYLMNKYEWTLKPRLGLALLIAYGLFIILTCMLEFNLFGHVNPPACLVVGD